MMKSGFFKTAGDDQLSGWTEKKLQSTSQSQTCSKKVMATLWWCAVNLIHYSFLNPGETITSEMYAQQINEMHLKLQCLQPALVNRRGPTLLHGNAWPHAVQPRLQNRTNCATSFASAMFTWPLTNQPPLPQAPQQVFAGKMFHNQQEAENAFQEFVNS